MGLHVDLAVQMSRDMIEHCIRLSELEKAFCYSVRRDGVVMAIENVPVAGVPEPEADCEYYGGSQVMD